MATFESIFFMIFIILGVGGWYALIAAAGVNWWRNSEWMLCMASSDVQAITQRVANVLRDKRRVRLTKELKKQIQSAIWDELDVRHRDRMETAEMEKNIKEIERQERRDRVASILASPKTAAGRASACAVRVFNWVKGRLGKEAADVQQPV